MSRPPPLCCRVPMPLVAGNKNWVTLVAGINHDYLVAREWQITGGRSFTGGEIESGAKVAMVGSVIIEELFDGRAGIGETFRIGNVPFTVIGVLDKKGLGAAGRSQDDIVFIPLSTAKSRVLGAVRGTTREALDFILVKVSDAPPWRAWRARSNRCSGNGTTFAATRPAISGSKIQRTC